MARDNHALDLIGSVPDLVDLGVPEVSLEAAGIACASQSPEKEVSTRASHDPVQLTVTPPSKATIAAAVPGSLNSLQEGRGAAQKTETGSTTKHHTHEVEMMDREIGDERVVSGSNLPAANTGSECTQSNSLTPAGRITMNRTAPVIKPPT